MYDVVSVIITTYNRPFSYLNRAIKSIQNQTYTNLEIIIIDDSPNDNQNRKEVEKKVAELKDNRIKYVQNEKNEGACKSRNRGIKISTGSFIAFLDDDDEWLPEKIELQLNKFKDKRVGLVYCASNTLVTKGDKVIKSSIRKYTISGNVFETLMLKNFIGSTSFVVLKREALELCGLFNEELKSAQDFELWLRIAKEYAVDFVDIPLVNYYAHDGERITSDYEKKIQGLETVNELNKDYLNSNPKALSMRKMVLVPYYAQAFGKKRAIAKWMESLSIYPFQKEASKYLVRILRQT